MLLTDCVALVTGGASGLGAATIRRLAAGGAKVVIVDRDAAKGEALAAELGAERARFAAADVTDAAAVEAAVAIASELGPLRIAVSCAGVGWAARTLDKTGKPTTWRCSRPSSASTWSAPSTSCASRRRR
jgi:NAD(P)-dependent dehydrogenase (short-subunit alcohol dehydrogenase family)